MVFYVYIICAAAAVPLLDNFYPVLRQRYSIWLVLLIFICSFLLLCLLQILLFLFSLLMVNLKKPPKCMGYYRTLGESTLALVFKILRVNVLAKNGEKIPDDRRFVLVCNHTHALDPVVLSLAFPNSQVGYIAKTEIMKEMPIVAKYIYATGGVFVDRDNSRDSAKAVVSALKMIKNDKASVGIFPEGHRTKDGNLGEFKEGAFKIAKKARVPIVVCKVFSVADVLKGIFINKKTPEARVIKTIFPEEYENLTSEEICRMCRELILKEEKGR